ncbi:LOW QUALITY PROTEIN: superoxide dismutase [Cu-Zn]-like [Penaeus chinensis]|uniref:LOW QUALITY PROTEIN: superoxide dismutase [Cu-Zn]-like n=1 Tax=Penaeus chinensis TaxID=139456 RepID=UPI001FB674B7|nr:LOW QUALITY PROTEIN: superoxide dismutase [Cu-Zn]-like [Penaeus chinensis]
MRTLAMLLAVAAGTALAQHGLHSTCVLVPDAQNGFHGVSGTIDFLQKTETDPVHVTGMVYGLTEGKHGFHIHTAGVTGADCSSTGGHFNPDGFTHGAPTSEFRHVGDLGNIDAYLNGTAFVDIMDTIISLHDVERNITGRALVVHAFEDDLGLGGDEGSLATGNAGARVACCTISQRGF